MSQAQRVLPERQLTRRVPKALPLSPRAHHFLARLCSFSKHTLIAFGYAICSCFLSLDLSSSSLKYLGSATSGGNITNPLSATRYLVLYTGASLHYSSAASLALRAKWQAALGASPSVTVSMELRSRLLTRRSCTTIGAAGAFEDVGDCYARSVVATWK
jgi:hypothetical protein